MFMKIQKFCIFNNWSFVPARGKVDNGFSCDTANTSSKLATAFRYASLTECKFFLCPDTVLQMIAEFTYMVNVWLTKSFLSSLQYLKTIKGNLLMSHDRACTFEIFCISFCKVQHSRQGDHAKPNYYYTLALPADIGRKLARGNGQRLHAGENRLHRWSIHAG